MPSPPDRTKQPLLVSTTLDQSGESHVTRLHRAVIGPVAADYYLPVLARLDTRARAIPIWNWAACLCTLNWMVFRGLWGPALLYASVVLGAAVGVLALTTLASSMVESLQWSLWAALITLALLAPGFFGNAWLYGVYRKRLTRALTNTASLQEACLLLNRQSSSRPRLIWILLANSLLAGLLLAVWATLPARPSAPRVEGNIEAAAQSSAGVVSAGAVSASIAVPSALAVSMPASVTEATTGSNPSAQSALPAVTPATSPAHAASAADPTPSATNEAAAAPMPTPSPAATTTAHIMAPLIPEMRRSTRFRVTAAKPPASSPVPAVSAAAPAKPAPAPAGQFLINVGLFAQDDNARRAHARLREAGLPAFTQQIQGRSGKLTRVRVGPFATRADADAAAGKIRALQLDAAVFRQ